MRKIVIASLAAILLSTTAVKAQEDSVYVNLSVLDSLGSTVVATPDAPMFPIVKPQPKKKPAPFKKAAPKPAKKKAKPLAAPKPEENKVEVIVVDREPIAAPRPAPLVAISTDNGKTETIVAEPQVQLPTAPVVAEPALAEPAGEAPSVPVKVNLLAAEPAPEVPSLPEPTVAEPTAILPSTEPTAAPEPQALLVEPTVAAPAVISSKVTFAEGETTLTEAHKTQIDAVVASFSDAANNKIAIHSYNLDDGVDSFRKKRQSLNRAVEIRSYLLQKGYKNFSIKVLNITSGSDKINSVELEELK